MPLVEIKYFNALIDNKPYFDHSVKTKLEVYEKPWKTLFMKLKCQEMMAIQQDIIRLFISSKILETDWYKFIKTTKYKYSSKN